MTALTLDSKLTSKEEDIKISDDSLPDRQFVISKQIIGYDVITLKRRSQTLTLSWEDQKENNGPNDAVFQFCVDQSGQIKKVEKMGNKC